MKLYKYEDGQKIQNYPFLCSYTESLKESWQAKAFGITMPIYFVYMIVVLITITPGTTLSAVLMVPASVWFVVSYVLLVNRNFKDSERKVVESIRGFVDEHGEKQ